ncbi:flagellin [Photobacterium aquimaris]|uniref:Flagellin n=1 Tax=Photobacterium aquimaris TaxID=512643 RepID=A0A2T3I2K5_9GAMM|nr:flagellin [Photobacterium aquimaris]OBU24308.1 branched-chain alpha-keto acid dehydrogenase subunit E2 [Photobacterium aquimaris]PQJ40503.1 branched-chain alpha-keto acid dehydrogenase subunit E2 [Photobacterium aquimaris]PSU12476.1 flagellin [Photobacterium aquimaris]
MAVTVNTNVSAMTAQRYLNGASNGVASSMEKLSSGLRINSAKDDAAGLQISNRLTSQTNGLNVAMRNANDGISMAQTAEGAMSESTNILQRMRDLSLQAANGSNSGDDRAAMQKEVSALQEELTRISETTTFGGQNLLDGSFGTKSFQIGSNANETIDVSLMDMKSTSIGNNKIDSAGSAGGFGTLTATADLAKTTTDDITVNGKAVPVTVGTGVTGVAAAINSSGTGVKAEAKVDTTISNLDASADGTLTIGSDTFDLATYNGDTEKLAEDINKAGHKANFDSGNNSIALSASDVDGVQITGKTAGTVSLGGTAVTADATLNSTLKLTSGDDITLAGTDRALMTGSATSTLASIADVDLTSGVDGSGAQDALDVIDAAIAGIDSQRADLGAVQNRFNHTLSNLANINENVTASNSRIKDVDFASETTNMTKNQILQQASTSILAQAKQIPQSALSLLG